MSQAQTTISADAEGTGRQMFGPSPHPIPTRGYSTPLPSSIHTWRKMRGNPTIALSRVAATSPILLQNLSIVSKNDAREEVITYAQDYIKPLMPGLIKDLLLALDYGFSAFELVDKFTPEGLIAPRRIKYLEPSLTSILQDFGGHFVGLAQGSVVIGSDKALLFTYDREADNLQGRPRNETVRLAWSQWCDLVDMEGVYLKRVSNILPIVHYPSDESFEDAEGNMMTAFEAAQLVVKDLCDLRGVVLPSAPIGKQAQALINAGIDPAQLKPWALDYSEPQGNNAASLASAIKAKEVQMVRGWLLPERSILEGNNGTLAESVQHTRLGLESTQILMNDIMGTLNSLLDRYLAINFGESETDTVDFGLMHVSEQTINLMSELVKGVMESDDRLTSLGRILDINAMADALGLPKAEETI